MNFTPDLSHSLSVTMVDQHLCGWYKIAEHCFVPTVEVDQSQELSPAKSLGAPRTEAEILFFVL